jgi:hypothetical protein
MHAVLAAGYCCALWLVTLSIDIPEAGCVSLAGFCPPADLLTLSVRVMLV